MTLQTLFKAYNWKKIIQNFNSHHEKKRLAVTTKKSRPWCDYIWIIYLWLYLVVMWWDQNSQASIQTWTSNNDSIILNYSIFLSGFDTLAYTHLRVLLKSKAVHIKIKGSQFKSRKSPLLTKEVTLGNLLLTELQEERKKIKIIFIFLFSWVTCEACQRSSPWGIISYQSSFLLKVTWMTKESP